MSVRMFEGGVHARAYKRYRPVPSGDVLKTLTGYVWQKAERKPTLTVDVGCGSGQATELLASISTRVLGIDVSQSQIAEATQAKHPENITYMVGPAESLPVEDGSVSLLTAFVSAHWFDLPTFMSEAKRVLEPRGSLVICSYMHPLHVECGIFSEELTQILLKVIEDLRRFENHKMKHVREDYTAVFETIPFADKKRVESIGSIASYKLPDILGLITSFAEYQVLKKEDPDAAQELMEATERRFQEILGDSAASADINIVMKTVLLLACNTS